jgi:hypothetical protein
MSTILDTVFGDLVVLEELAPAANGKRRYQVGCDTCGGTHAVFGYQLLSGALTACPDLAPKAKARKPVNKTVADSLKNLPREKLLTLLGMMSDETLAKILAKAPAADLVQGLVDLAMGATVQVEAPAPVEAPVEAPTPRPVQVEAPTPRPVQVEAPAPVEPQQPTQPPQQKYTRETVHLLLEQEKPLRKTDGIRKMCDSAATYEHLFEINRKLSETIPFDWKAQRDMDPALAERAGYACDLENDYIQFDGYQHTEAHKKRLNHVAARLEALDPKHWGVDPAEYTAEIQYDFVKCYID